MSTRLVVRVTAPVLVISGLLLMIGVVGAWYVQRMQRAVSEDLLWNVHTMRAAEELEIYLREAGRHLNLFRITGKAGHLEKVSKLRPEADYWLKKAKELAVSAREKEMMTQATRNYDLFFQQFDRLPRQLPATRLNAKVRQLEETLVRDVLDPVHAYLDLNEEEVEQIAKDNQNFAEWLVFGLLLLGTCGAGAGLVAGFGIARGLRRSLVQLSVPIRDAAGKLSEVVGPVMLSAGWGFQELEGILRRMADHIGTVIERLQQSQREVVRAEQLAAVGQLAAGMAHELRNPLMAMKVLVQAAAAGDDPAGLCGRDLTVLDEEISRLERLLQTFLDFARPPEPEKRLVDVQQILDATVGLVAGRAARQGVCIRSDPPRPPVLVEADVGQVRQVVLNLLLNALDVLPGGGTVWVEISKADKRPRKPVEEESGPLSQKSGFLEKPGFSEGQEDSGSHHPAAAWLVLRVADNGPGLPAKLGQHIFEPFVSTKETGIGLGLSICRRIIEAHGGEITAANRPGGGAVFTVRLPLLDRNNSSFNGASQASIRGLDL
jgi:signal transduction histidine kinase